jgi:hypothetical protein
VKEKAANRYLAIKIIDEFVGSEEHVTGNFSASSSRSLTLPDDESLKWASS